MARLGSRRAPVPIGAKQLEELALRYVGRYATSRAKLTAYLERKLRDRGWDGVGEPRLEELVQRFSDLGYVDDAAFAMAKSRALSSRGYGRRRLDEKLRSAGIDEHDGAEARDHADAGAVEAALRFARRRKIGPFAAAQSDPKQREKAIAAMVRAGHSFGLAREIADMPPGSPFDIETLRGSYP